MAKTFKLGAKLHYPITIQRVLTSTGDKLAKRDTVLEYSYVWYKDVGDEMRGISQTRRIITTVTWASPADGEVKKILVREGQVLEGDVDCVTIEEACSHEVQFQGMCGMCGMDMTTVNWASDQRDTDRAPINMTHDHTNLTVSEATAQRHASEQQKRLLEQRKLSLVVDLDQTIIHACIDPTVGEWQRDPKNPNYNAVKDVRSFQLSDEGPRGLATGCWYYIKLRPGLAEFLESASDLFELHVYTMGTRAYAQNIAKLVDPDQKLFGNRLISRDESGSMTTKTLARLFPTSTGMVAIIDDRADVWPHDRDNLIKVVPYDFFKGIGDINSSFLPRRQDIAPAAPDPSPPQSTNPSEKEKIKTGEDESSMKLQPPRGPEASAVVLSELAALGGDDSILLKKQAEEQEQLLEKQLKERPLLYQQEQLDKEDEAASATQSTEPVDGVASGGGAGSGGTNILLGESESSQHRHNLLRDDDTELIHLADHLANLHTKFYQEYDRRSRLSNTRSNGNVNSQSVPDVGRVLSGLKSKILAGTTVVLSGLVPVDIPVHNSELGRQVRSFGATLQTKITSRTTHLVISTSRPRTQKARQAARIPGIKIVNQNWLLDCMSQWRKLDTKLYTAGPTVTHNEDDDDHLSSDDQGISNLTNDEDDEDDEDDDRNVSIQLGVYTAEDGESSPIDDMKTFDWGEADDELADFLHDGSGEDEGDEGVYDDGDEDEETENVQNDDDSASSIKSISNGNETVSTRTKRKLNQDEDDEEGDFNTIPMISQPLVKRQKTTWLRDTASNRDAMKTDDSSATALPTPVGTGDEEMYGISGGEDVRNDDLEADLMAMLEAEVSEKG